MLGIDGLTAAQSRPDPVRIGWFGARQPGIVRYLESCLAGDALAVAVEGAFRICEMFRERDAVPPPRAQRTLLERATAAVIAEALARRPVADGCAARQPAVVQWLQRFVEAAPSAGVVLDPEERRMVGTALAAVVYVLDELTTGRPVP